MFETGNKEVDSREVLGNSEEAPRGNRGYLRIYFALLFQGCTKKKIVHVLFWFNLH